MTTDQVSKDAKRVFEELARDDPFNRLAQIVYIEGLKNAENALREVISSAAIGYARQRLAPLGELAGYDLGMVLKAKYDEVQNDSQE